MKLDNMEFSDFVNIDNAVKVSGQWDDNDIINQIKASDEAVKDEEICELLPSKEISTGHFKKIY